MNAIQDAFDRLVVEIQMGYLKIIGQRLAVDREAVILTADHHPARRKVLHRMVGAVMPVVHLAGRSTQRQRQHLMAEADPEGRYAGVHQFFQVGDDVLKGGWVSRAVA